MQAGGFAKRVYTFRGFVAAMDDAIAHLADLRAALRAGRVDRAFAERIMLAVTHVNGCRYCDFGHTRAALLAGVSPDELNALRAGLFGEGTPLPGRQIPALLFAQHYAAQGGRPDPAARQRLVESYGADIARDILAFIRMIMIGNLLGNTFDGFWSRLAGRPALDSSLLGEVGVLAAAALPLIDPSLGAISPPPVDVPAGTPLTEIIMVDDFGEEGFEPCSLVTEEEFEALLGPLQEPPLNGGSIGEIVGVVYECYTASSPNSLSYSFLFAGSPSSAIERFRNIDPSAVLLEGIRDEAWLWSDQGYAYYVNALRGNVLASFMVSMEDTPENRERIAEFVGLVIERLFERAAQNGGD